MKVVTILVFLIQFNYLEIKNEVKRKQELYFETYKISKNKSLILNNASTEILALLTNSIFPKWYGTKWNFDGHTEIPKKGNIACGYFVSTTLRDVGFNLNRFKLAQKNPLEEAQIISCGTPIENYYNISKTELIDKLKTKPNGLYFIGLDFHVGFIVKQKNGIYFIHSNYINQQGVVKENINNSLAIISKKYHLVTITKNNNLLKKWITRQSLN